MVKANFFNNYFSEQYATVDNGSSILQNRTFATEQKLSTFEFCTDDIRIKLLDSNKARGHNEISFRFIKVCVSSVELCGIEAGYGEFRIYTKLF